MRAVLPLWEIMLEVLDVVDMVDDTGIHPFGNIDQLCSFKTVIHKDNSTALSLALNQKVTTHTKHWNVKFHFFWSHINEDANNISVVKVDTKFQ